MEAVGRDVLMPALAKQLTEEYNPWDYLDLGDAAPQGRQCTYEVFQKMRIVCKSWREALEATDEFACMKLARQDLVQALGARWVTDAEFIGMAFDAMTTRFKKSWRVPAPIPKRLRTLRLAALSTTELGVLRNILEDLGCVQLVKDVDDIPQVSPFVWVPVAERL